MFSSLAFIGATFGFVKIGFVTDVIAAKCRTVASIAIYVTLNCVPLCRLFFVNHFRIDNRAIGFLAVVWCAVCISMRSGLASCRLLP